MAKKRKEDAAAHCGKILTDSLRKLDIAGRWNDTSFIILLPETELSGGIAAARKIRKNIESSKFANKYQLTASIAVAEFAGSLEDSIKNLILLADSIEDRYRGSIMTSKGVCS